MVHDIFKYKFLYNNVQFSVIHILCINSDDKVYCSCNKHECIICVNIQLLIFAQAWIKKNGLHLLYRIT